MFGKIAGLIAKPLIDTVSGLTNSFSSSKAANFNNPFASGNCHCGGPISKELPLGNFLGDFANRISSLIDQFTDSIKSLFSDFVQPKEAQATSKESGGFLDKLLGGIGGSGLGNILSTVGSIFGGAPVKVASLISKLF